MEKAKNYMNEVYREKTGTTTLALKFKEGVILASDRQATTYYKTSKIQKIFMLTKEENLIGISIAGSAGDAINLVDLMRSELQFYRFENGYQPSVKTTSSLLSSIMYNNYRRYQPYYVQFIIGGIDKDGSHIFNMDMIGSMSEENFVSTGSGSLLALSKLEDAWKDDLTRDDGKSLAIRAIKIAATRDLYTGYGIDLLIITKDGVERDRIEFPKILDN